MTDHIIGGGDRMAQRKINGLEGSHRGVERECSESKLKVELEDKNCLLYSITDVI